MGSFVPGGAGDLSGDARSAPALVAGGVLVTKAFGHEKRACRKEGWDEACRREARLEVTGSQRPSPCAGVHCADHVIEDLAYSASHRKVRFFMGIFLRSLISGKSGEASLCARGVSG